MSIGVLEKIVTDQHQTLHLRIVLVQQLLDAPRPLHLAARTSSIFQTDSALALGGMHHILTNHGFRSFF